MNKDEFNRKSLGGGAQERQGDGDAVPSSGSGAENESVPASQIDATIDEVAANTSFPLPSIELIKAIVNGTNTIPVDQPPYVTPLKQLMHRVMATSPNNEDGSSEQLMEIAIKCIWTVSHRKTKQNQEVQVAPPTMQASIQGKPFTGAGTSLAQQTLVAPNNASIFPSFSGFGAFGAPQATPILPPPGLFPMNIVQQAAYALSMQNNLQGAFPQFPLHPHAQPMMVPRPRPPPPPPPMAPFLYPVQQQVPSQGGRRKNTGNGEGETPTKK